jgi:hypothetical protein
VCVCVYVVVVVVVVERGMERTSSPGRRDAD